MSALTDLFTAFANKIRSKTGGSATYTPPQMVNAIDDVYDAGVAAGTPTLTGDATASDVMSGKTFYNNSTTKQTGSYVPPTITSITPSNSSPVSMTADNNYKPSANGYAISSYTSISTAQLDSGVYFSSGMKKMASSGYAYSSQAPKIATGTYTSSTTAQTTINLGFKPKQLTIAAFEGSSLKAIYSYDENVSTTTHAVAGSTSYLVQSNFGTTTAGRIYSINNNGFTVNKSNSVRTCYYFAIG